MPTNYLQTASGSISWTNNANWSDLVAPTTSYSSTVANSSATIDTGFLNTATLTSLSVPMTFTGTCGLASQVTKAISGITRTSTTATGTSNGHGYNNGDVVVVSGSDQSAYNITATISNITTNTFDYTVAGSPTNPATGTMLVRKYHALIQPTTALNIGAPSNNSGNPGNGPGRWVQDLGTVQSAINIFNTNQSSSDTGLEPVRLIGSHASNVLNMLGGTAGIATTTVTETATLATVNQTGGTLNLGAGVTWTNLLQSGGNMNVNSGAASGIVTQSSGSLKFVGAGTIGTLVIGGTCIFNLRKATAGDTITTSLTLDDGAVLDLTGNPANLSVTALVINGDVTIKRNPANPGHFSWTTLTQQPGSVVKFT